MVYILMMACKRELLEVVGSNPAGAVISSIAQLVECQLPVLKLCMILLDVHSSLSSPVSHINISNLSYFLQLHGFIFTTLSINIIYIISVI